MLLVVVVAAAFCFSLPPFSLLRSLCSLPEVPWEIWQVSKFGASTTHSTLYSFLLLPPPHIFQLLGEKEATEFITVNKKGEMEAHLSWH